MALARTGSKREAAEAIFVDMTTTKKGKPRAKQPKPAEVKAAMAEQVGMTIRQAATYYHNIKSGKWER